MKNFKEKSIYLVWRAAEHQRRLIIGELKQLESGNCFFQYTFGSDLDQARKTGFEGYPAFSISQDMYENAIEAFSSRLPSRSRMDFKYYLNYWEISDPDVSDFDLLSITGGRLATDRFEFLDAHEFDKPAILLTELAAFSHYVNEKKLRKISSGVNVALEMDPENKHDTNAIKVVYKNSTIGYLNRVHAKFLAPDLRNGKPIKASVKNIDANGVINSVLLKLVLNSQD